MTGRRLAATLWVAGISLCVAGAVFAVWNGHVSAAVTALLGTVVPTVGVVVARHVPRNPVGWCQLAGGLLGALGSLAIEYDEIALTRGWPAWLTHLLAWGSGWVWLPALAGPLVFTALWFPDGRLVVRAYRPVLVVAVVAVVGWSVGVGAATWGFSTRSMVEDSAPGPSGPFMVVGAVSGLTLVLVAILAAFGLVVRWRRADVLGRAQLKWVGAGLSTVVAFVVATEVVELGDWQNILGTLSLDTVAVTMGVAVLRYRLYEIDRIVSRTVTYAVVLAVLGTVYAGIVLGVGAVLPERFGSFGVALATLAVSALFLPLTRRARRVVDHRFNRRRFDAEQLVTRFAERTRHDVSHETTQTELLRTVAAAVQPAHATLWVVPR